MPVQIEFTCEDFDTNSLYPFTLTRDVLDIRCGILTIREKWKWVENILSIQISKKDKIDLEIKIPVNAIPFLPGEPGKELSYPNDPGFYELLEHPWQISQFNDHAIRQDFKLLTSHRSSQKISSTNKVIGKDIFIEEGAVVEYSILNASGGPIYIGKNAEIMEGCMIRGPFAMCEGSVLKMGTKIYPATTVGPYCIAAGEIKNSVLFGYSNKAHDGYLGDSVIGEWCNLGAGTTNSNLKNTAGQINIWNDALKKFVPAGTKCGLLMGDYSRSSINTSFNTGTVVGVASNVFFTGFPPCFVQSFSWGDKKYKFEKALEHINNWKSLKGKKLEENEEKILSDIYQQIK